MAVLIIALFLLVAPQAYADFSFHNQFSYVDETKIMHILGEIRNDSDSAMKNVRIMISFYDKEGNLLDQYQRTPALQVINPGESSPFEILYLDPDSVERVANFTTTAQGQDTELKETELEIISSNSRLDILGTYYINAVARNNGQEEASNAILIATLYDKDSRVIAIGRALAEAGRGSSNITAGSEAPFGIAVTDKLQTYKTSQYSLVVDSDRYMSEKVVLQASSPGIRPQDNSSNNNEVPSGCLIATAAFGSELAPQVQQLRIFRDEVALKTYAGSSFMNVFNAWYYSFSPTVADYERQNTWLQNTVKALIHPLLGILTISTYVHDSMTFSEELGIVATGITASSLISLLYLAPLGAVIGITGRRKRWDMSKVLVILACAWAASIIAIILGQVTAIEVAMMVGTSILVLTTISTVVVAIARLVIKS